MTYQAKQWCVPKKLTSMMNLYLKLNEEYKTTHKHQTEQQLWMLKTDILNLLFKD